MIAQQTAQTQEGLLDEYQQAHAERDLYFNRKHEQKEISGLPIDKAREYLQAHETWIILITGRAVRGKKPLNSMAQ